MGKSRMSLGTAAPTVNYFFDSHGGLYAPCLPAHPEAIAFGPTGTARRAQPEEVGGLFADGGRSPWAVAMAENRIVVDADGWNWLTRRFCSPREARGWLRGSQTPEWDEDLIAVGCNFSEELGTNDCNS